MVVQSCCRLHGADRAHSLQGQRPVEMREQFSAGDGIGPQGSVRGGGINLQQQHLAGVGVEPLKGGLHLLLPGEWMKPTCSKLIPRVEMR